MRTQDEIETRIRSFEAEQDWMGDHRQVLIIYLDFDRAREWLKDEATPESWATSKYDPTTVEATAADYLEFAFEKAADHRGLSADRSVSKLSEWAWLMGYDDLSRQMVHGDNYAQYGVPALVLFANAFGLPVPNDPALERMAKGEPCEPGCYEGCGT